MPFPDFDTLAQQYIFGKLNGAVSATVYDDVPQMAEGAPDDLFPYVALGSDTSSSWEADDYVGRSMTVVLHIWSRAEGFKETKALMGEIYNILHRANGPETGYRVRDCWSIFSSTSLDPDRRTRHGVMQFRLILTE